MDSSSSRQRQGLHRTQARQHMPLGGSQDPPPAHSRNDAKHQLRDRGRGSSKLLSVLVLGAQTANATNSTAASLLPPLPPVLQTGSHAAYHAAKAAKTCVQMSEIRRAAAAAAALALPSARLTWTTRSQKPGVRRAPVSTILFASYKPAEGLSVRRRGKPCSRLSSRAAVVTKAEVGRRKRAKSK